MSEEGQKLTWLKRHYDGLCRTELGIEHKIDRLRAELNKVRAEQRGTLIRIKEETPSD